MLKETEKGLYLQVKIIPNSSKNKIIGKENKRLKIKINAAPDKGKANKELINFLAKTLIISKSNISIAYGALLTLKTLLFKDISIEEFLNRVKTF